MAHYSMRRFHIISPQRVAVHCGLKLHEIDAQSTEPLIPCAALLASLARSAALICSLVRSLTRFRAHGKEVLNASVSNTFNPLCSAATVSTLA